MIRRRGCAILALADQLLTRGFQITMKLVESFVFEGKKIVFSIQIHQSPLELNDAVFVLANPLCLRRLGFAVLERVMHRSNCEGYGCPEDFSVNELFSDDECGFYFCSSNHEKYHVENYIDAPRICGHLNNMIEQFNAESRIVIG